jgi:hypothetical protein
MTEYAALVAIFPNTTQAEFAISSLKRLGFETTNISVFGRTCASESDDVVGLAVSAGKFMACGGLVGFWERMCDTLGDGGFYIVSRIGGVAIAGRFVNDFVDAVDDDSPCGALTALGRAICRLGISKEDVLRFELEIQANECAVLAVGTREQVASAKTTLYLLGVSDFVTATDGRGCGAHQLLQEVG